MYEQFYKFIAQILIDFLKGKALRPGEKFELKLSTQEEIIALNKVLASCQESEVFRYETPQSVYETTCLKIDGIKIIIASDVNGVQTSFLASLRNLVGTEHPLFQNTGVLFIHNSSLDTLISGADKLQKEGMPLHYKNIDKHIEKMLKEEDLDSSIKAIIKFILGRQSKFALNSPNYLAEYREMIQVLAKGKMDIKQYEAFGLFYDSEIGKFTEKEAKERLEQNAKYYAIAHNYHELNVRDNTLDKDFDKRGNSFITSDKWKTVDYKVLNESLEKQRNIIPIEYIEQSQKLTLEGLEYWEKGSSETAAGRRTRHIIVFNPDGLENTVLELSFSQNLKKTQCDVAKGSNCTVETRGKKLQIILQGSPREVQYSRVKYKDKKNYEFRVLVLPFEETAFREIMPYYSLPTKIKEKGILIQKEEAVFSLGSIAGEKQVIQLQAGINAVTLTGWHKKYVFTQEFENLEGESIGVNLEVEGATLNVLLSGEPVKPKPITYVKIAKLKREKQTHFIYQYNEESESIKLFQGTDQYFVQEELLRYLKIEIKMLQRAGYSYQLDVDLAAQDLGVSENLKISYDRLRDYYRSHNLLPSLAYLTEELENLMKDYLACYKEQLSQIQNGMALTKQERDLLRIGSLEDARREQVLWSPLHPLNIAYTLQMISVLKAEAIDEAILRKLSPSQLIPYFKTDQNEIYKPVEQPIGSWLVFGKQTQETSHRQGEISRVIEKALESFRNNFRYLFHIKQYPMQVNLVNIGDGTEVIGGILRYLHSRVKLEEKESITPIELKYYSDKQGRSVFHELGHDDELVQQVLSEYLPSIKEQDYEAYSKLFRDKISIYKVEHTDYEAAHISFVGPTQNEEISYRNMLEINATVRLEGLVGGKSCYLQGEDYVKTLGLKGIGENTLIQLTQGINALLRVGSTSTPYNEEEAIALSVRQEDLTNDESIEACSDWTVYLEPPADDQYFNQKVDNMIHYVDRFSTPATIDAITLSKKIALYQQAIREKMNIFNIHPSDEQIREVIQLANTLNGEWLVELLAFKKNIGIESFHTVALIKWIKRLLDPTYRYWVPISLHEFLRTCEGTGLQTSKGFFSLQNYERFMNDLLWIGYRIDGTEVEIAFYPMSVGGQRREEELYKVIKPIVEGENFESRYFRQLLIQKAEINGKLLGEKKFFVQAFQLDEAIQYKLINDQYTLSREHQTIQGKEAVVKIQDYCATQAQIEKGSLKVITHIEALWLEAFAIQTLEVVPEKESKEIAIEPVAEEVPQEVLSKSDEQEGLEDVPVEARYSILYYIDELLPSKIEVINNYLKRGIKPYILVNADEGTFMDVVGRWGEKYKKLIKNQILTICYQIQIEQEIEEPFIADGVCTDVLFYQAIKQTAFNIEQYEIEHEDPEKSMIVKAGAGTGKTKVMIDRIMYLKHIQPALRLEDIIMITFTNESTMEMRSRLARRIAAYYEMTQQSMYLSWMDELASMRISTIHAFAKDMIGLLGEELGIIDLNVTGYKYRKVKLIEEAVNEFSMLHKDQYNSFRYIKHYELNQMILAMSDYLDNRGIGLTSNYYQVDFGNATAETQFFFKFVLSYVQEKLEKLKEETSTCEMNDLIKQLRELKQVEGIKQKCEIQYMMVDEFQDTDEVQVDFIAWLVDQLESKLFVVGDIKQSIYRFRGADYTAFRQVEEKLIRHLSVKQLTKNYRSDQKLMNELNHLFGRVAEAVEKFEFEQADILEATAQIPEACGLKRVKIEYDTDKFVALKNFYQVHKAQGSVCALVRTNKQVRELVDALEVIKVPVIAQIKGGYYTHPGIRDFYLLIRVLLHPERLGEWVILENSPYGKQMWTHQTIVSSYSPTEPYLGKILRESPWYQTLMGYSQACQTQFALKVIQDLLKSYKPHLEYAKRYYHQMKEENSDEMALKRMALHQGKTYEAQIDKLFYLLQKEFTDQTLSLHQIEQFLKVKIATDRQEECVVLEEEEPLQALRIMTVHQSKGLEFDTVFLPYTKQSFDSQKPQECIMKAQGNDYQLGYRLTTKDRSFENNHYQTLLQEEGKEKTAEETRLLYVACTRAKANLYVICDLYASKHSRSNSWQDLLIER